MRKEKRHFWVATAVLAASVLAAGGINLFYNDAYEARGLDQATFQVVVLALLIVGMLATLALAWFATSTQDEVVRAADRISVYWGWSIGVVIWALTPWLTPLPELLVEPFSNPDGDTLFTLSEAAGAYVGGGFVLIGLVAACSALVKAGWWVAKR